MTLEEENKLLKGLVCASYPAIKHAYINNLELFHKQGIPERFVDGFLSTPSLKRINTGKVYWEVEKVLSGERGK